MSKSLYVFAMALLLISSATAGERPASYGHGNRSRLAIRFATPTEPGKPDKNETIRVLSYQAEHAEPALPSSAPAAEDVGPDQSHSDQKPASSPKLYYDETANPEWMPSGDGFSEPTMIGDDGDWTDDESAWIDQCDACHGNRACGGWRCKWPRLAAFLESLSLRHMASKLGCCLGK